MVSRFRLSRQSDSGKSLNQEDPVFSEGGEEASAEEEKHIYSDQSEAVSLKTVDASGIMYEASDDKESQLNVDKDQQGNSDFIKMMDSEIDKLDRQLTELRVQRESIKSIGVNSHQFFFLPHQNLAKLHHLSSDAKDSKPLNYINTDIREQNIYNYD